SGRRGWKRPFRYLKRLNAPTSYFHFSVRKNPLDESRGEVKIRAVSPRWTDSRCGAAFSCWGRVGMRAGIKTEVSRRTFIERRTRTMLVE
ncbi:hypothetical protein, partial [Salinibacter ruber]|uniref:hypothetical protein n=1 Tax=Salinibacter ruber TaxID=146919 RepID=UPI00216A6FDF